jgi:uncharacterized protein
MTRVLVTGGTGLIGGELVVRLRAAGHTVTALGRDPASADQLAAADAVVNLAGEPINQRWTSAAKGRIRDSRVVATRNLVAAITELPAEQRPAVLISQSATGYYGPREDEDLDEHAGPGADFLAGVVQDWEDEALVAQSAGVRVVLTRTGVVLSKDGGALKQMLPPFRLGIGGPIAGGGQWISWISLADVVGAIIFLIGEERASGPVNLTAPEPVRNREFSKALGKALHRPAVMPVPGLAMDLLYGEMSTIVTTGQRVLPAALIELGYCFEHASLTEALSKALAS